MLPAIEVSVEALKGRCKSHGITVQTYLDMAVKQNYACGICRRSFRNPLVIDHDHRTGKIRGLLCTGCNTGLGRLGDSRERVKQALDYLNDVELYDGPISATHRKRG